MKDVQMNKEQIKVGSKIYYNSSHSSTWLILEEINRDVSIYLLSIEYSLHQVYNKTVFYSRKALEKEFWSYEGQITEGELAKLRLNNDISAEEYNRLIDISFEF